MIVNILNKKVKNFIFNSVSKLHISIKTKKEWNI